MRSIAEMNFGFGDAENYKRRDGKNFFERIFVRTDAIQRIATNPGINFVIGEKGTGKTAHAVYLTDNPHSHEKNFYTYSSLNLIRESEYTKFVELKRLNQLALTSYTEIWKVILLLLLANKVVNDASERTFASKFFKFRDLQLAINEFYEDAFSPEIVNAITFVEEAQSAAKLISRYAQLGDSKLEKKTYEETKFQLNLLYLERKFSEAFRSIKLNNNHLLFIDGIDLRPQSIDYDEYLLCIKGLAEATWSLNNDFFPSIRDTKGRMRVVLLMRPDIFQSVALQNQNNKIRDNSVFLDWRTTYAEYRRSDIFRMADRLLRSQQEEELELGQAWDYYFPFLTYNHEKRQVLDSSFISLLRLSYYRPRDVVTILRCLQESYISRNKGEVSQFEEQDFAEREFLRKYSDYLLGEIEEQLLFYYGKEDYQLFIHFFSYLDGRRQFTYGEYCDAFEEFISKSLAKTSHRPKFFESEDTLLQFLYELNIICYEEVTDEGTTLLRWCFRERSPMNLYPRVVTGERYSIHLGLTKALNVGRPLERSKKRSRR
jgi:hypothetical protein